MLDETLHDMVSVPTLYQYIILQRQLFMYTRCFKDLRTKHLYAEDGGKDRVFVPPELEAGQDPNDHKQKCIKLKS